MKVGIYTGKYVEMYLFLYDYSCCKLKVVVGQTDVMELIVMG